MILLCILVMLSPRKQPTFGDATTGFQAKWRLRNEHRNSTLMTRHYPDLGSPSDWLNQISHAARPIRSTTQIWVATRHQYGISALISQTSFRGEISGGVANVDCFLGLSNAGKISSNRINVTLVTPGLISFSVLRVNSMMRRTEKMIYTWTKTRN